MSRQTKVSQIKVGNVYGYWTVLKKPVRKGTYYTVYCRCKCGTKKHVYWTVLTATKYARRCQKCARKEDIKHGKSNTEEYTVWRSMIQRCTNPRNKAYHNYGGRGIKMCKEWRNSFEKFYQDMGPRPSKKHSIDRIDNNKGYYKENCRWATKKEQMRNHRRNRRVILGDMAITVIELAETLNLPYDCIYGRIKLGWTVEKIISTGHKEKRC